jgi:hypothetical protein
VRLSLASFCYYFWLLPKKPLCSLSLSLSSAHCKQQRISVSLRTFYFFLLVSQQGSSNYPRFWNSGQGWQ